MEHLVIFQFGWMGQYSLENCTRFSLFTVMAYLFLEVTQWKRFGGVMGGFHGPETSPISQKSISYIILTLHVNLSIF